jgi:hypothetical protein
MSSQGHYPVQLVGKLHPLSIKLNDIDSEYNSLLSLGAGWNAEPTSESRDEAGMNTEGEKVNSQSGGIVEH